ncbi:MAG: hypothetical protein HKN88_08115 [Gammaproteobacteria bacterium]|nr:hypothetical protein [Gammaproteobacteria bacterium]NNC98024.1 hypothetical protein [Gammaproteobacteria bacterium]NNM13433.1 hypothetical protein [Gammaproteobacteria bacterium]
MPHYSIRKFALATTALLTIACCAFSVFAEDKPHINGQITMDDVLFFGGLTVFSIIALVFIVRYLTNQSLKDFENIYPKFPEHYQAKPEDKNNKNSKT